MNNKIDTRRHRMGGPGGGPHGMMPGEKAKAKRQRISRGRSPRRSAICAATS